MSGYRRVNYYELCRLCTSSEGVKIHIFCEDGKRRQLQNKIQECLPVQVCEDDSLPKIVCTTCLEKVEEMYDFRENCITSEGMLESYFTSMRFSDSLLKEGKVYIKEPERLKIPKCQKTNPPPTPPTQPKEEYIPEKPQNQKNHIPNKIQTKKTNNASNVQVTDVKVLTSDQRIQQDQIQRIQEQPQRTEHQIQRLESPQIIQQTQIQPPRIQQEVHLQNSQIDNSLRHVQQHISQQIPNSCEIIPQSQQTLQGQHQQQTQHQQQSHSQDQQQIQQQVFPQFLISLGRPGNDGMIQWQVKDNAANNDRSKTLEQLQTILSQNLCMKCRQIFMNPEELTNHICMIPPETSQTNPSYILPDIELPINAVITPTSQSNSNFKIEIEKPMEIEKDKRNSTQPHFLSSQILTHHSALNSLLTQTNFNTISFNQQIQSTTSSAITTTQADQLLQSDTTGMQLTHLGDYQGREGISGASNSQTTNQLDKSFISITNEHPISSSSQSNQANIICVTTPTRCENPTDVKPPSQFNSPTEIIKDSQKLSHQSYQTPQRPIKLEQTQQNSPSVIPNIKISSSPSQSTPSGNIILTPGGLYHCEICEKTFKRKEHLMQHRKLHSGERPYVCMKCNKSFSRKEHLIRHEISHTGEKVFECEQCHKSFSRKDNLHKHRKTHLMAGPYVCETCNKSFVLKHYYTVHKLSHKSVKTPEKETDPLEPDPITKPLKVIKPFIAKPIKTEEDPQEIKMESKTVEQKTYQTPETLQQFIQNMNMSKPNVVIGNMIPINSPTLSTTDLTQLVRVNELPVNNNNISLISEQSKQLAQMLSSQKYREKLQNAQIKIENVQKEMSEQKSMLTPMINQQGNIILFPNQMANKSYMVSKTEFTSKKVKYSNQNGNTIVTHLNQIGGQKSNVLFSTSTSNAQTKISNGNCGIPTNVINNTQIVNNMQQNIYQNGNSAI